MTEFIGRRQDLAVLDREFSRPKASLAVLYGRRRIGKSTLIQRASLGRPAIYFQATLVDDSLNLEAFKKEIARALGSDPILDGLADWLGVFHYVAGKAEQKPGLIVALDEFPYLVGGNPGLPSIIQKFWDSGAAESGSLKIVLCGSLIAQMEELLAERNPLFGRMTLSREIGPMSLREAAEFMPGWDPANTIAMFSVLGGVPYYLAKCDSSLTVADNIKHLFLTPSAPLQEEPEFLLRSELNDARRYASVAAAIADGATKPSEIVSRVHGFTAASEVSPYIARLQQMRIVLRERSLDTEERSRNTRYSLQDPMFRFWYRFVRPNLSALARGFGDDIWMRTIKPHFNGYMGTAFESVCREHLRDHARERFGVPAGEIGRLWGSDFEIDVAGRLLDGAALFGECKWENAQIGEAVRKRLDEAIAKTRYAEDARSRHLVFFARKGFTDELRKIAETDAGVCLFEMEELVRAPDPDPHPHPTPSVS